ncbi:MAG: TatD family hydrolase, partial [Verrucomicrobiota bacterium]
RGVLLHSYGGPAERVPGLARQGAYFGFSGWFLHPRKRRQLEVFRRVPPDRLLVETDAPDQPLPVEWRRPLPSGEPGAAYNHPAQLSGVYAGLAAALGETPDALARRLEDNFGRWTGAAGSPAPASTPGFPS